MWLISEKSLRPSLVLVLGIFTAVLLCAAPNAQSYAYSYPFTSPAPSGAGNGQFVQSSSPVSVTPIVSSVQSYNNANTLWLITCPNKPAQNGQEYISSSGDPLLGGNACQASSGTLSPVADLHVRIASSSQSFATASASLSFTDLATLNVQDLAYSGEAYNNSRGIGSANISNGYSSYSNIFSGVPPSAQGGIWGWDSEVADLSNLPAFQKTTPSTQYGYSSTICVSDCGSGGSPNNVQCNYQYYFSATINVESASNINIPVPVVTPQAATYLAFNNQTYNGVTSATPSPLPATADPNAIAMSECYLPNFWGKWHLVGTNGELSSSASNDHCVYQYGDYPYYFTNSGSGPSAQAVYVPLIAQTYQTAEQVPLLYYNATIPAAYSSATQTFAFYNSSYDIYSQHNLQSPGNYIDPVTLHSSPAIFLNANGVLAELSYDSFFGGNYYAPSTSPPGLNLQATSFASPGSISSIANPIFTSESANNNLFVIGGTPNAGYILYDLQTVPQGELNLTSNPPPQYAGSAAEYNSLFQSYWNNVEQYQSFPGYITNSLPLQIGTPLALASDYAGDAFVLSANVVQSCPIAGPCSAAGGAGFNLLYISANGVALTSNVASGPSNSLMNQFGTDIRPIGTSCAPSTTCNLGGNPAYMAVSPSGQYLYVAEQNLSYVLIYSLAISSPPAPASGNYLPYPMAIPPTISISPDPVVYGQNTVITATCAGSYRGDSCEIEYPQGTPLPSSSLPASCTSPNPAPGGQSVSCTVNTIALGGIGTYTFYANDIAGLDVGSWASEPLVVTSTPQYTLSASFVTAVNLSYSNKLYNFSIDEYLLNGGPFDSNGLKQWAAASLNPEATGQQVGGGPTTSYAPSGESPPTISMSVNPVLYGQNTVITAGCQSDTLCAIEYQGVQLPDALPQYSSCSMAAGNPPFTSPSVTCTVNTIAFPQLGSAQSDLYLFSVNTISPDTGAWASANLVVVGTLPTGNQYSCQYFLNDTPGEVPCWWGTDNTGNLQTGIWHMPLGISISGSTLYVLDNWLFVPYTNYANDHRASDSMLMLRAFYLNGTEIPIHPSNFSDVNANPFGATIPSNTNIGKGLYPPYGWPISANYSLAYPGTYGFISYCTYLCNNTPRFTSDQRGANVIYGGYPPIGPFTAANNKIPPSSSEASGTPYAPPTPLSLSSDFNNTVYLDTWAEQATNLAPGSVTTCHILPSEGSPFYGAAICQLYTELLAVHMNVDNYTKTSNASASPPYGCYLTTTNPPCGYLNNEYTANSGIAPSPNAYTCYIGANAVAASGNPKSASHLTPCTQVDNLSLQSPPFIGMPNSFNYVESLGSADTYLTVPNLLNAYLTGGDPSGPTPPTIVISPGITELGQNVIVATSCANTQDTCDIEYPQGTQWSSTSAPTLYSDVVCNPQNGESIGGQPAYCTFNTNDLKNQGTYVFYSSVVASTNSLHIGSFASANLIVSNTLENQITTVIQNSQSAISGALPSSLFVSSYLRSYIGGYLLVPYTYTYQITDTYSNPSFQNSNPPDESAQCPAVSSVIPSTYTTLPSNVYTYQPVYASSLLNETIQSGQIIPQYINTLKYYIANLSDQYLIMPPQVYLNVFTNRVFGDIYVNQTVGPSGFQILIPQGGAEYASGAYVINAIHILNYSQTNVQQVTSFGEYPGYSAEAVVGLPPTPLTTHSNAENAINASWIIVYNEVNGQPTTVTLDSPVFAQSITINKGVTLITDGYSLVATGTITNDGSIIAGYVSDEGLYGSSGYSKPYSYGGSGGGAAATASSGVVGGNTLAPGGSLGQAGSANTLPSLSLTDPVTKSTLEQWAYDSAVYLSGAGGASSAYASNGGSGSFGIYLQANDLYMQAGTISTSGQGGMTGSGGGGGGVIVIAYPTTGIYMKGTYSYTGGSGGSGGGASGGNGNYIAVQYQPANTPVLLSRFNSQPAIGAACTSSICQQSPYYYAIQPQPSQAPPLQSFAQLTNLPACRFYIPPYYSYVFCGNSLISGSAMPLESVLQLFSALKVYASIESTSIDLTYNANVLGYNRLNYTFADEFNNIINMPIDADLANITTISLNPQTTINDINPNETSISVSGTAGYYPSIYAVTPSPVPENSLIYLYYDTNINYFNTTNTLYTEAQPTQLYPNLVYNPASAIQWAEYCAFALSSTSSGTTPAAGCAIANPALTTNPPIGQGPLAVYEANVINFHTQYNSIGECSPEPNSLLLPTGVNTEECNIYPGNPFGLPTSGNTVANVAIGLPSYPEYCVPYFDNGNGVLTSQLGLVAILPTGQGGHFSYTFNVCGTGTAILEASYYGYPANQPRPFLQTSLQSASLAKPVSIAPSTYPCGANFASPCTLVSNQPLINTVEYNYSESPNTTATSFPIGTYYLSFGSIAGWVALIIAAALASYVLLGGRLPKKS